MCGPRRHYIHTERHQTQGNKLCVVKDLIHLEHCLESRFEATGLEEMNGLPDKQ